MDDVALSLGERLESRGAVGGDELRAELWLDVAVAARHEPDCCEEFAVGRALRKVAGGAGGERTADGARRGLRRHDEDPRLRRDLLELRDRLVAALPR